MYIFWPIFGSFTPVRATWLGNNSRYHHFTVIPARRSSVELHFCGSDQIFLFACHFLTAVPHLVGAPLEAISSVSPAFLHLTAHGEPWDTIQIDVCSSKFSNGCWLGWILYVIHQTATCPLASCSKDNLLTTKCCKPLSIQKAAWHCKNACQKYYFSMYWDWVVVLNCKSVTLVVYIFMSVICVKHATFSCDTI